MNQKGDKISIGYVLNNLDVGGISRIVAHICNSLDAEKYNVYLFILAVKLEMKEDLPFKNHVKVLTFNYNYSENYSLLSYIKNSINLTQTKKKAKSILESIKQSRLDILHFFTHPRELTIGILAQKDNKNLQLVFTDQVVRIGRNDYKFHQQQLLAFAYRLLYKKYHIVASSKAVKQNILNFRLFNRELELNTLDNSIEIKKYNRTLPLSDIETNKFIYISRMNHHKGQDTLIIAWKKLKHPKKGLLFLVGPDESNGKFEELAGDDNTIIFTGRVSEMTELLNNSTIGLFPSQKEGLPLAMLEMMAYELPIIVSDIPELTNIVRNRKEGLHFKLDNIDDLVLKMELLLNNQILSYKLGKEARKRAEEICKKSEPITFYSELYNKILKNI